MTETTAAKLSVSRSQRGQYRPTPPQLTIRLTIRKQNVEEEEQFNTALKVFLAEFVRLNMRRSEEGK